MDRARLGFGLIGRLGRGRREARQRPRSTSPDSSTTIRRGGGDGGRGGGGRPRNGRAGGKQPSGNQPKASWRYLGDGWELLVGVDRVFWGVTESRHLVDVVNQDDAVEDVDGEDKLGQPMVDPADGATSDA